MGKDNAQLARIENMNRLIEKQTGLHAVRPYRADGYVNLLNRYGTNRDTSENYFFQADPDVPDEQLTEYYEGNGLFAKIIDTPAEEAMKHGFELSDIKDDKIVDFYKEALDELDWEEIGGQCLKWNRLYGGAIAVLLVNDGSEDLATPLDWRNIRSIDDIRVYERSVVQPDYSSVFSYDRRDPFNARGSRLGAPEYYYVYSKYGSFTVHESRCLVFKNGTLPENSGRSAYEFWGIPEYIRIQRAIRDAEIAHGSAAKMLDRSVQAVYSMKDLSMLLSTEEGEDMVMKRLQTIDMARGLMNSIVIDSEGEDYNFRSFSYSGVSQVIDTACNFLSALTSIPQTILFGRSPAGMNATGHGDLENFYNYVERIQKRDLKGNLRYLLSIIFQAGLSTGEVDEVPKINVEFNPLWSMDENEKVALDQAKASLQATRASVANTYVQMQVIDPMEVRKKLADSDEFDIDTLLDEYDEEELFENAPQQGQPGAEGGDPMAAMMGGGGGQIPPAGPDGPGGPAGLDVEEHNTDPGGTGSTSTAAPAATKMPQDMTTEEKKTAEDKKRPDREEYLAAIREALHGEEDEPQEYSRDDYISAVKAALKETSASNKSTPVEKKNETNEAHEAAKRLNASLIKAVKDGKAEARKAERDKLRAEYIKAVKDAKLMNVDSEDEHKSVGVIVVSDGYILCGRRDNDSNHGEICGPGGHIEPGESAYDAAIRETQEEFGITPTEIVEIGYGPVEPDTGLSPVVYLCTDYEGTIRPLDGEMIHPVFMTMEEINAHNGQLFEPFVNGLKVLESALGVEDNNEDNSIDIADIHDKIDLRNFILQFENREDADGDDLEWITTKTGAHIPLDPDSKKAVGGAGGEVKGQTFSHAKSENKGRATVKENSAPYHTSSYREPVKNHFPEDFPNVQIFTNKKTLTEKHKELYDSAKHGNFVNARDLVEKCVYGEDKYTRKKKEAKLNEFVEKYKDAVVVPVMPQSLTGGNMIPFAYAQLLHKKGMQVDTGIKQTRKFSRTESNQYERLFNHPEFEGEVKEGQTYVLLDDHYTLGGTLNSLRQYIESKGGKVVCCTTLSASRSQTQMAITKDTIAKLKGQFGSGFSGMLRDAGIAYDFESLTEAEGKHMLHANPDDFFDKVFEVIKKRL